MVEITDYESAKAWLETQPFDVQAAFAIRCVLRHIPSLRGFDDDIGRSCVLMTLRTALTVSSAIVSPSPKIRLAAENAMRQTNQIVSARHTHDNVMTSRTAIVANHLVQAAMVISDPENAAQVSAGCAIPGEDSVHGTSGRPDDFAPANDDRLRLGALPHLSEIFDARLWDINKSPDYLERDLRSLRAYWQRDTADWAFWDRWYDSRLQGEPLDWDLQEKVALIPSDEWDKGPERIAELITEIEARHALQLRAAEFETLVATDKSDRLGIGGNRPPEPISDISEVPNEFVEAWGAVQSLKTEAASGAPKASLVRTAISQLTGILRACGKWTGGKLDTMAEEAAKSVGKAAGTAGLGLLAHYSGAIQAVVDAAKHWLQLL